LETGSWSNPDGFGWGIVIGLTDKDRELITYRSMNATDAIDSYLDMLELHGDYVLASAYHARITTHGKSTVDNCHPWQVGKDEHSVLFHNGILSVNMAKDDPRSDSGFFANDILPRMGGARGFQDPNLAGILETWTGSSNKLVLLTAQHGLEPLSIIGEKRGEWIGDHWYSNSSCFYKPVATNTQLATHYGASPAWGDGYYYDSDKEATAWEKQMYGTPREDTFWDESYADLPVPVEIIDEDGFNIGWKCGDCGQMIIEGEDECSFCYVCFVCAEFECTCQIVSLTDASLEEAF